MKRFFLLSFLVFGLLYCLSAQYQFDHVGVIESQSQSDLGIRYQVIDKSSNERIICGRLNTGSFNFDPGSRSTLLQGSSDNNVEYVAKYDNSGELIWAEVIRATSSEISIQDLKVANNGDIYISLHHSGGSSGGGNDIYFDPTSTTPTNSFSTSGKFLIAKYDKDFDFQWSRAFQGTAYNEDMKLTVINTGVVAAMSTFGVFDLNPDPASSFSFGSTNERSIGISLLDANGNFLNGVGLSGSAYSNTRILDLESGGTDIYLAGHPGSSTSASLDLDPGAGQNFVQGNKAFIAKYDGSLNLLHKLPIPDKRFDRQINLHVETSNIIYAVGSFNGTKDLGGTTPTVLQSNGLTDLFVAQYDGNLDIQWANSWGGPSDDGFRGSALINGGIVLQGKSFENILFTQDLNQTQIASGAYLMAFNQSGDFSWYKDFKNTDLVPLAIGTDANFDIYPIGRFRNSSIDFDPNSFFTESLTSGSNFVLYLSKFTACSPLQKTTNLQGCPGESFEVEGTTYTEDKSIYRFASAANGCDSLIVTNIQFHPGTPMVASASVTNPSDCGLTDGQISIAASGGNGFYFYSIDGITFQTTNVFSNLDAGLYNIEVKDSNGCSVYLSESLKDPVENNGFELDPNTPLNITNVTCAGANDGTASINFLNIFGTQIDYSLNGGSFTPLTSTSFANLAPGDYTLDLRTIDGCVQPLAFTITEPEPIVVSIINVRDATCYGGNGLFDLEISGGTGDLEVLFNSFPYGSYQGAVTDAALAANTYNVEVIDENNCVVVSNFTINEPAALTQTATITNVTCNQESDGGIEITASGGTGTITYSIDGGNTYQSSNVFDNLAAGSYTIQLLDNNQCIGTKTYTITQPDIIEATITTLPATSSGFSDGVIEINTTGGTAPYTYSIDGITFQSSNEFTGLMAGSYTVSIEDAQGCKGSISGIVEEAVVWSGSVDTDWGSAGNWVGGAVPTISDMVYIPGSVSTMPVVVGYFAIDDILVATGAEVTINTESSLSIQGAFTGGGSVTMLKNVTGDNGYNIIGSPIAQKDLSELAADYLYDYDGTAYFSPSGVMPSGKGYFVGYTDSNPTITLSGSPNVGIIDVPITTAGDGFNIVANPYLAAIDRAALVSANNSVIDGNIWLWNDGGQNVGGNRGGDYILINNMGSASTVDLGDGVSGGKPLPSSNTPITSFQGFLVNATANANVVFEPTMQVTLAGSNGDGNFYRKAGDEYATIKLSLSNAENYNETLVGLVEGATFGQDYALDGAYRSVNPDFAFYSMMGEQPMAIQAIPAIKGEGLTVPLEVRLKTSGLYDVKVEELKNLSGIEVYLKNEQTEEYLSLEAGLVSLELKAGVNAQYSLVFKAKAVLGLDHESDLQLYGDTKMLSLVADMLGSHEAVIYDLTGAIHFQQMVSFQSRRSSFPVNLKRDKIYILKVDNQSIKFILN